MKKLFSGRWLLIHLLIVVALVVLVNLGLWQLRRLEQRRASNESIRASLSQPLVTLTGQETDPEQLHRRRVSATGRFDNQAGLILQNRPYQGRAGVHLVVPLLITGSNRAVLVNRGWIPLDNSAPDKRLIYEETGTVTVEGIAYRSQEQPDTYLAAVDPTLQPGQTRLDAWYWLDIDRIQNQVPAPLLPVYIKQSPISEAASDTPPIPEEEVIRLDEGSHLGYALQWFSFALILLITYGVFIRQELKKGK